MNKIYIRGNEIATKEYVDSLSFSGGGENVDLSNYYTKEEIDDYGLYVLKDLKICSSSFSGGSSYLNWVDTDESKCAQISAIFNQAVFNHDFRPVLVMSDRNDSNQYANSFSGIIHPAFSRSDLLSKNRTSYWYKGIDHNRSGYSYTSFNDYIMLESVGLEVIGEWQEDGSFKCTSYAFLLSSQTLAQTEWTNSNFLKKTNTTSYTPTADYNPATKIYVDTTIQNAIEEQPTTQDLIDEGFDYLLGSETVHCNYTVTNLSDTYQFILNENGYYESNNKGIGNSYALCRVNFNNDIDIDLTIDYISFGENKDDFGIFSKLDSSLTHSNAVDGTSVIEKSCKGESSADIKQLIYHIPAGEHFIEIKYRKDGSIDNGNDSLKFKIPEDQIIPIYENRQLATKEYVDNLISNSDGTGGSSACVINKISAPEGATFINYDKDIRPNMQEGEIKYFYLNDALIISEEENEVIFQAGEIIKVSTSTSGGDASTTDSICSDNNAYEISFVILGDGTKSYSVNKMEYLEKWELEYADIDWDQIINKPFGEKISQEDVYILDYDTRIFEEEVVIEGEIYYYKYKLTEEEQNAFHNIGTTEGTLRLYVNGEEIDVPVTFTDGQISSAINSTISFKASDDTYLLYKDGSTITTNSTEEADLELVFIPKTKYTPIPEELLPEGIATKEYIYELLSNINGIIDVKETTIDNDTFNNMKTGDIYRIVNSNTRIYYNGTLSISTNYANALFIGSTFPLVIDGNNITCLVGGSKYTLNMTKIVDADTVLTKTNTTSFTPTGDYNPATKKYVDDLITTSIAGISTTSMEIATSLPTENISTSTIYLVKDETASTDTENIYNEYIYVNGAWENIGSTKTTVDLSQYSTTEELSQMLSSTLANYLTAADLTAALSDYYTKTAADSAITKATQKGIQAYYTMPEQNSENAGKVYQYLGTTNSQFTKGHFYYLEENVDISPSEGEIYSYNWIELETQNPADLSKYSTTAQMNEAISNAVNGIETGSLSKIGDTLNMSELEDGLYTWEGNKINTGSSTISAQMVNSPTTVLIENGKAYFHTNTGDLFVLDKATMNIKQINYMSDTLVYESDLSNYYTKTEIDTMIGDINSILDTINGEEV